MKILSVITILYILFRDLFVSVKKLKFIIFFPYAFHSCKKSLLSCWSFLFIGFVWKGMEFVWKVGRWREGDYI
jgi:hypothetical protein